MILKLIPVSASIKEHVTFLYELLKERPSEVNISHKKMPSFDDHWAFVASKPYLAWYLIENPYGILPAGSVYLTHQYEIGLFIAKEHQGKGFGTRALKLLMDMHPQHRFLANVASSNPKSQAFFERQGFKLIQKTYEKTNA